MASSIPYMLSPSAIPKILAKIQEARRPDRFTIDFLETKLGHSGGAARPIIPLLKRMGFIQSDGVPTELYNKFRNAESQGAALAVGIKSAFSEIFERNEYANDLPREKLTSLLVEITGLEKSDRVLQAMVATFWQLKEMANFENALNENNFSEAVSENTLVGAVLQNENSPPKSANSGKTVMANVTGQKIGMNLSYTINLNLPETTNPDVFNAIFKSLRENLLRD